MEHALSTRRNRSQQERAQRKLRTTSGRSRPHMMHVQPDVWGWCTGSRDTSSHAAAIVVIDRAIGSVRFGQWRKKKDESAARGCDFNAHFNVRLV